MTTTPTGWGAGPWGATPWGVGAGVYASLEWAQAYSEKTIRVRFSAEVVQVSPLSASDALNPRNWAVTRGDTGAALIVLAVGTVDERTLELATLQYLGTYDVLHTVVASSRILTVGGTPVVAPLSIEVPGVAPSRPAPVRTQQVASDLLNAPLSAGNTTGALVVAPDGDYALHSGPALVRKLIMRRLTTDRGAFAHLPGYGITYAIKGVFTAAQLPALKRAITDQVLLEPEVRSASVGVSLEDGGVVVAHLGAAAHRRGDRHVPSAR